MISTSEYKCLPWACGLGVTDARIAHLCKIQSWVLARVVSVLSYPSRASLSFQNGCGINRVYCYHRYKPEIPTTCAIFIAAWGSNWGSSGFYCNQNNCGLSGVYVTCIYRGPSVKINMHKTLHGAWRSWPHLFCVCGQQKPEDPQFEPMAGDAITWGRTGGLDLPCLWLFTYLLGKLHWCSQGLPCPPRGSK